MSAAAVAANDDLLTEILLRLPVKPLIRSKCVSKHWHSLVSSPYLCQRKSHDFFNKIIASLLVQRYKPSSPYPEYDVVPLDGIVESSGDSIVTSLNSGVNEPMEILQSCNGLFCCRTGGRLAERHNYYICNPTTGQFKKLPDPIHRDFSIKKRWVDSVFGVLLAFDPAKGPHFKVVCFYFSEEEGDRLEMEIYSSETHQWKHDQTFGDHLKMEAPLEMDPQPVQYRTFSYDRENAIINFRYEKAAYWNGAINWCNRFVGHDGLYFNIEEERFVKLPKRPIPNDLKYGRHCFVESNNHLLLVDFGDCMATQFDVYGMDREYSGWSMRYHIDVEAVMDSPLNSKYISFLGFDVLSFGWDLMNDEMSFVVLSLQGQAVRYNLRDKSFNKIWDFTTSEDLFDCPFTFSWRDTFCYIQSIYCF